MWLILLIAVCLGVIVVKPFFMNTFKGAIRRVMDDLKKAGSEEASIVEGKHILVVDDMRDAMQAGMDAHVAKPVQLDILKAAIRQALDSRKQNGLNLTQERSSEV